MDVVRDSVDCIWIAIDSAKNSSQIVEYSRTAAFRQIWNSILCAENGVDVDLGEGVAQGRAPNLWTAKAP